MVFFSSVHSLFLIDEPDFFKEEPLTKTYSKRNDLDPVILVPGLGGSRLQYKNNTGSTWGTLWLTIIRLLDYQELAKELTIDYDAETETYDSLSTITVRVQDYGGIDGVASIETVFKKLSSYYGNLIEALIETGYTVGTNLFGAPYDWRRSTPNTIKTNGMCSDFKELIEYAYEQNSRPVVLVGHSMGCTFIYEFLTQYVTSDWKNTYVKKIILTSPPLGGAVEALAHCLSPHKWGSIPIPGKLLHPIVKTLGGIHWMLPNYNAYDNNTEIAQININDDDPISLVVGNMSYGFNISNRSDLYITAERMINNETSHFEAPEVPIHFIYSNGSDTCNHITINGTDDDPWYENEGTSSYGDGDGTVPIESLTAGLVWADQQTQEIETDVIEGPSHTKILRQEEYTDLVVDDVSRNL